MWLALKRQPHFQCSQGLPKGMENGLKMEAKWDSIPTQSASLTQKEGQKKNTQKMNKKTPKNGSQKPTQKAIP